MIDFTTIFVIVLAIGTSLLVSFFFSGAETAVISADQYRLRLRSGQGDRGAARTLRLLDRLPSVMSAVLIGTNLGNVFAALFFKMLLERLWVFHNPAVGAINWEELICLAVLTPLLVIFCEILPKALFRTQANQWIGPIRPAVAISMTLFAPAIKLLDAIVVLFLAPFGGRDGGRHGAVTRGDLIAMLNAARAEEPEGGDADAPSPPTVERRTEERDSASARELDERHLIHNIVDLERTQAREIMRPLVELEAIHLDRHNIESFLEFARKTGHSRFPVYRDRIVNLIGYLNVYDVLRERNGKSRLEQFVRDAHFVPETKRLDDLLREFLDRRIENAIVVDEYGGCSGWISREDIIEEIVGELEDELDEPTESIVETAEGVYEIDGRADIHDVNDALGAFFEAADCDTLGGLVMKALGRIPKVGDEAEFEGWRLSVLEMDNRRVARIEARSLAHT
jgi:putative hemolysin